MERQDTGRKVGWTVSVSGRDVALGAVVGMEAFIALGLAYLAFGNALVAIGIMLIAFGLTWMLVFGKEAA